MANQLIKTVNRFSSLELSTTSVQQYEWLNEDVSDLNDRVTSLIVALKTSLFMRTTNLLQRILVRQKNESIHLLGAE
jgi:hypothetical protein